MGLIVFFVHWSPNPTKDCHPGCPHHPHHQQQDARKLTAGDYFDKPTHFVELPLQPGRQSNATVIHNVPRGRDKCRFLPEGVTGGAHSGGPKRSPIHFTQEIFHSRLNILSWFIRQEPDLPSVDPLFLPKWSPGRVGGGSGGGPRPGGCARGNEDIVRLQI